MKKILLSILTITVFGLGAKAQFQEMTSNNFVDLQNASVAFADVDGDNDQDVIMAGSDGFNVVTKLYLNDGNGNFSLVNGTPFIGVDSGALAFADVDGDNDQDVLITGHSLGGGVAKLYTNDGAGNFTEVLGTPFIGVYLSDVAFADIDGDNDEDLIIIGEIDNPDFSTKLYTNDGNGNFTEVNGIPFPTVFNGSVAFEDVDGDNDFDLLILGATGFEFVADLYLNNGSGTFTIASGTPFTSVYFSDIAFADIDGDNDLDLLITGSNAYEDLTKLYKNFGNGNFLEVAGTPFDGVSRASSAFADVDGDGDQDLLITGKSGTESVTKLYSNDGSGDFTEVSNTPFDIVYNSSIAFADIDGDSDQDVLITGRDNSNLPNSKMYENLTTSVSVIDFNDKTKLSIYPNPTTSQITLNTTEQIESISIIDIAGKTVKVLAPTNNTIDVSKLVNGIYFLQVQTINGIVNRKFTKE